ncbi:hypothetical protein LJB95_00500 [Paludibacteraceae bacterium OttesenSCG-928-F17]|nr:hypothetical protein [Paludibacteraceae bacterium OttesenSCG-928-F17]
MESKANPIKSKKEQKGAQKKIEENKKKIPASYLLSIPENLNLEEMLDKNPPSFNYHIDNFVYIASLPNSIMESIRDNEDDYERAIREGYVPFYSPIIQQKVHDYKKYIDYFLENNVLETDNKYSKKGGKSIWYRYTSQYNQKTVEVKITKRSLIKNLFERTKPHLLREAEIELLPEMALSKVSYLTKWFNSKLRIDMEKAKGFLLQLFNEDKEIRGEDIATRKYNSLELTALKINNPENIKSYLSIDKTVGRFHSPLTNLKSELRNYLTYDNKKLVSLDLKNSQPFLSLALVDYSVYQQSNIKETLLHYYGQLDKDKGKSRIDKIEKMLQNYENRPDIIEYKKSVASGDIYETIGTYTGSYLLHTENENTRRKNSKNEFIKVLFGINYTIQPEHYTDEITPRDNLVIFSSIFPSVYNIFQEVKHKKYAVLAWILQHFEADLILHTVCKQIAKNKPKIPLFTIHDSVVTTVENADYVESEMKRIIKEKILHEPRITKEYLEENNTIN